jgi:periplasmic protein TonB
MHKLDGRGDCGGLGYGLDAKTIQTVQQWCFQPALKGGRPVNVQISVEVGFHLY